MKQLSFISFFFGLLFTASFVVAQGILPHLSEDDLDDDGYLYHIRANLKKMEQIWPIQKLDESFYKNKLIVVFNISRLKIPESIVDQQDKKDAQNAFQMIQNMNKLQKQGMSSGQFVVIGLNSTDMDVDFYKKCRVAFPVYDPRLMLAPTEWLINPPERILPEDLFLIIDPSEFVLGYYNDSKQLLQSLKRYIPVSAIMKRIKSLPLPHPLEELNLSLKECELLSAFEPGKPWLQPYKSIENAIEKNSNKPKFQIFYTKVKRNIDHYISFNVPKICEDAKIHPAANMEKLVLLGKSLNGLPGGDLVNETLAPLQEDKNVAELAKIIIAVNKFKATSKPSKGLKKKADPYIASLRKFIDKPMTTPKVNAEAVESLEQLINYLPENEISPEIRKYLQSAKLIVEKEKALRNDVEIADADYRYFNPVNEIDKETGNYAGKQLVKTINGVEFSFRFCPPGTFMMGSPEDEKKRDENETQHKVILTKGFWMLETEVTQKQWNAIMGNVPFKKMVKDGNGKVKYLDDYPVTYVRWEDCQEFCKKCKKLGLPVQLPTEAQWEYACRAGSSGPYAEGKEVYCEIGEPLEERSVGIMEMRWEGLSPVGKTNPNKWNLYDMHYNANEWCFDIYDEYPNHSVINPTGGETKYEDGPHVIRGGRSAQRERDTFSSDNLGFRVVLVQ